jgi:membrane-associated phospholipid phosphatase
MFKRSDIAASNVKSSADPVQPTSRAHVPALLLAAGVLLALAGAALAVDLPIARSVRAHELPGEIRHFVRLAECFGWGGTVGLIILAAAILDPRGWRVIPRLAIGAFGAGLGANAIKLLVVRSRPSVANLDGTVWETFGDWLPVFRVGVLGFAENAKQHSFPSGHTATAVGLAIALSALYPRGRWLFAALAALAALQRIEVQAHFLSDVVAGAAVGCLIGAACSFGPLSGGHSLTRA